MGLSWCSIKALRGDSMEIEVSPAPGRKPHQAPFIRSYMLLTRPTAEGRQPASSAEKPSPVPWPWTSKTTTEGRSTSKSV